MEQVTESKPVRQQQNDTQSVFFYGPTIQLIFKSFFAILGTSIHWMSFFYPVSHHLIDKRGGEAKPTPQSRSSRNGFPKWNKKYCAPHFWRRCSDFTRTRRTRTPLSGGARGKEETRLDKRTAGQLRRDYPNYVPLDVAVASARNSGMSVSTPSR